MSDLKPEEETGPVGLPPVDGLCLLNFTTLSPPRRSSSPIPASGEGAGSEEISISRNSSTSSLVSLIDEGVNGGQSIIIIIVQLYRCIIKICCIVYTRCLILIELGKERALSPRAHVGMCVDNLVETGSLVKEEASNSCDPNISEDTLTVAPTQDEGAPGDVEVCLCICLCFHVHYEFTVSQEEPNLVGVRLAPPPLEDPSTEEVSAVQLIAVLLDIFPSCSCSVTCIVGHTSDIC